MVKRLFFILLVAVITLFNLSSCSKLSNNSSNNSEKGKKITPINFSNGDYKEYICGDIIDPFKELEVTFSGEPEKGVARIDASKCPDIIKENFTFNCIENGNLINGKKVDIVAEYDKYAFEKSGIMVSREKKEYTVTGVDFYPRVIADYDKDDLNRAIRRIVDQYIESNIKDFSMAYNSDINRDSWSKSGSFNYSYSYYDVKMVYNVNKNNMSDNTYLIMYEITNSIECVADMDSTIKGAMKKGESDTGIVYMVAGASSVTANSNKIFNDNITKKNVIENIKLFHTKEAADEYCRFGVGYETCWEHFV